MNQETAVKLMLLEIKVENETAERKFYDNTGKEIDITGYFRKYLNLMYVVGYDQRGKDFVGHRMRAVTVVTMEGKEIPYSNIVQARKMRHYKSQIVQKALRTGEPTYRGEIFKYTEIKT
jgi:hypothetical protein